MEVNPDHRDVFVGLRFDVLDVVDARGEIPLKIRDDALLHLLRRQAVVRPHHAHDGNVDVRENVDGHGDDGGRAEDGDQNRHHHERIRATESEPDNPHNLVSSSTAFRPGWIRWMASGASNTELELTSCAPGLVHRNAS